MNNPYCFVFLFTTSQCTSGVPAGALIIDKQANEKSPFHHAVVLNKPEIAELLLHHGADVNQVFDSTESSRTPLQYACKHELMDMIKVLLKSGALDVDNIARKEALLDDKEEILQLLLNHGNTVFIFLQYTFHSFLGIFTVNPLFDLEGGVNKKGAFIQKP